MDSPYIDYWWQWGGKGRKIYLLGLENSRGKFQCFIVLSSNQK